MLCRDKYSFITIILLFSVTQVFTQTIAPSVPLKVQVDYARFRGDEASLYVEVYYAFPQRALTYRYESGNFRGGLVTTLSIVKGDSVVFENKWTVPHMVNDSTSLGKDVTLTGLSVLGLGSGDYVLRFVGHDLINPARKDSVALTMHVQMLDAGKVILSDLELASSIQPGKKESPFYKNTLDVVPNAGGVYSEDNSVYHYAEAYNLLKGDDRSDYIVKTVVLDAIGREISSREKIRKRSGESSVIVDNISTKNIQTGTYTLVLALLDSSKNILTSSGKKFFVYNSALGIDSTLLVAGGGILINTFAGVGEAELDKEFDWLVYESSDAEKAQYERLVSADAKRKFLTEFWNRRAPGMREELLARVGYANSKYQSMGTQGYKTDRGRVYLTYGTPNDIERHPSDSESRPYEIWYYHELQGGVIFVFVQRQSGGAYELVHSTHRSELHDEEWQRYSQITR